MKVQQLYTKCLAEATYYIMSNNEAAIIDPLRETEPYLDLLRLDKAKLKYIFLTHFHADFVSGHVDLAEATGATIIYGPTAKADFEFYVGKDNEHFKIGDIILKLLHTPGHTLESSSYLLIDKLGKEHCLFSGDTLFIGDVGRPDLAVTSTVTKEDLAGNLFESLHKKIMPLPNDIIIYPNHGKGSACGKNMSNKTFDTLGHQKQVNYALNPNLSKDDFVQLVLDGLTMPPQYFPKNAQLNKQINKNVNLVITDGLSPLSALETNNYITSKKALILDVRTAQEFCERHITNSIFIGLKGDFAPWVGALIENINQPIILVATKGQEKEAITRLSRIGYDNVLGFLDGGVDAWQANNYDTSIIKSLNANDKSLLLKAPFIDVRRPNEYDTNHVKNAINLPLNTIYNQLNTLDKNKFYFIYCAGGYRSVIATSILMQKGFTKLININGGFAEILKSEIPLDKCIKNCDSCLCN
ncbi:MBL fold metallo-hydrolase [Pontimicrobium sp. MEBiC06410]